MNPTDTRSSQTRHPQQPAQDAPADLEGASEKDLKVRKVSESMLDDAVEATFPASDPVALVSTKTVPHQP